MPAGVEITYLAVAANVLQIYDTIEIDLNSRGVTWLPMFHGMGLLTVILPALGGRYITIMSPAAFVRRPTSGSKARRPQRRRGHLRRGTELRLRARGRTRPAEGRRGARPVQRHQA